MLHLCGVFSRNLFYDWIGTSTHWDFSLHSRFWVWWIFHLSAHQKTKINTFTGYVLQQMLGTLASRGGMMDNSP